MTFSLRRLTITIVFVLLLGAAVVASVFLTTFDLNSFRGELSDEISSRISQPVNLGQAHFSLKHGPSFAFDNVLVGTKDASLHVRAEHVFFRLEVLPLLTGNIKFTEILFEKPDFNLKVGQKRPDGKSGRRLVVDQSLFAGDLVRSIRIKNGNFRFEDYRKSEKPFITALENMDIVIDDLSLRESGWVEAEGDINLNNIRSPLRISGYIKAGDTAPFWNRAHYELNININDLATDILSQRFRRLIPAHIHGRTDINLKLFGVPAEGLTFNTILTGRDLGITLPNRPRPILSRRISVSGTWQNIEKFHKFSNLDIEFGNMQLSGETNFNLAGEDPEIRLQLQAPRIAMEEFNRFFESSDTQRPPGPEFLDGNLELKAFRFVGPASTLGGHEMIEGIKKIGAAPE
jgi:hypothetical protein